MESSSLPLQRCQVHKLSAIINRSHTLIHSIAATALLYFRVSSFLYPTNAIPIPIPFLPWILIFASELLLFFIWFLNQAYGWRPVSRTVFPDRLPEDEQLPAIDAFICTADPKKEPALKVMNTALSVMALDYPPEKLSVYLSDDGGCYATLIAMKEAWGFAKLWVPFCRRYEIETRCPEAYFSAAVDDGGDNQFREERENIKREYEQFAERLRRGGGEDTISKIGQYCPPVIEIMRDDNTDDPIATKLPLLVYVSREKKPDHPHHFKAGALNALLRVSGVISNSPFLLLLDCDMYSNDPTSARQAMCFHLDQNISPSLAFVQFPQRFHNISKNDIYDADLRSIFAMRWEGMDGLKGPMMSGTNFYIKRKALYGADLQKGAELLQLKQSFGVSNEFIKSITNSTYKHNIIDNEDVFKILQLETKLLASCSYEDNTQWGQQIGFWYNCVVEDYFTGFMLHCKGWSSVFFNPSKPAFLGSATTNLNDTLVQGRRWNSGMFEVTLSRFCPLFYGLPPKMPILMTMCYGYFAFQPLYCFPVWILATIPQLCLLNHIPIYPKVSSPWLIIFSFVFLSSLFKYLWEKLITGGSVQTWWNEWRVWMIKSITSYFYGTFDAFFTRAGIMKASFTPTNKVADDQQYNRYQMGVFDFQAPTILLAPLMTLVIINFASFIGGLASVIFSGGWEEIIGQMLLSFFILVVNYPMIEGMIIRKDRGRVPPSVTLLSAAFALIFLSFGSLALMYVRSVTILQTGK